MGDGGVACMPLQHIMDKFPGSETFCGVGNSNGSNNNNGKLGTKSSSSSTTATTTATTIKTAGAATKNKKMKKAKKDSSLLVKKEEPAAKKSGESDWVNKSSGNNNNKETENGEVGTTTDNLVVKDDVEEGELGTLKSPVRVVGNGGGFLSSERCQRGEIEKGEIVSDRWREVGSEKGEIFSRKSWRRGEPEKSIFLSGRLQSDVVVRREHLSPEFGVCRGGGGGGAKDEIEKGEFIPDRWPRRDFQRDGFDYSRHPRYDLSRDRNWRSDHDWPSPTGKHLFDDPGKDFTKGILQHPRRPARWDTSQDRSYSKLSSKIVDDGSARKIERTIHEKDQGREQHSSGSRLKRHGDDPDRHPYDQLDYVSMKSRRLSGGDICRPSAHTEHFSRRSVERSSRNSSLSRAGPERHSVVARHHDYSSSSKSVQERSPHDRGGHRHHDHRDRTSLHRERSPLVHRDRSPPSYDRDRGRHQERRNRNSVNADRSPLDHGRGHTRKESSPCFLEQSPRDKCKPRTGQEVSQKKESSEMQPKLKAEDEEKSAGRDLEKKDQPLPTKTSEEENSSKLNGSENIVTSNTGKDNPLLLNGSPEKIITPPTDKECPPQLLSGCTEEQSGQANGFTEEPPSMEEDMDICDTPPHVPLLADNAGAGKWYYLDHYGIEQGPSKLCDLKALVERGVLMSDHLVKHLSSDRWVTVEHAASPLVTVNFSTVVSDNVTQLVSPPQATGNILADAGDVDEPVNQLCGESSEKCISCSDNISNNLHIDDRVEALLAGVDVVPGKELEALGEVLQVTFTNSECERWANNEGLTWLDVHSVEAKQQQEDVMHLNSSKDAGNSAAVANADNDGGYSSEFNEWFSVCWSSKGGDWWRNEEAALEWPFRKKVVLNDGYPLCQMPKSGHEDPRCHRRDELYYPFQNRRLDLPTWAFSVHEENNDTNNVGRPGQLKPVPTRGVKGTVLPVVRINSCVVKDPGSSSAKRSKEKTPSSKSSKPSSSSSDDYRRSSVERALRSKSLELQDLDASLKSVSSIDLPKDHICRKDELQLHAGEWYYLDGAGRERGPYLYSELQGFVDRGLMQKDSSVFRKIDQLWVPVTSSKGTHQLTVKPLDANNVSAGRSSGKSQGGQVTCSFHSLHPQFIGYTRGKLHELVMKSYKIREFAAAINEVLDPWINAMQPKKETEKPPHIRAAGTDSDASYPYEDPVRAAKRARLTIDGTDEDNELVDNLATFKDIHSSFEDVLGDAIFELKEVECSKSDLGSWGYLDGHVLARIFHFLREDVKSMIVAGSTCRHWRAAVGFYKDVSRLVDLSSIGSNCTDQLIKSIMSGFNKEKVKSMVMVGCTSVTSGALEDIIGSFSGISCIDIQGCCQFEDLVGKYPHINWIRARETLPMKKLESLSKMKSLDQIGKAPLVVSGSCMDDSSGLKAYFDMVEKRDAANQAFRQSLYRRTKVFDARKSASILSRNAQMRRWTIKKSENGFKKIEDFVLQNLRNIMKENTYEIFVPKVSEIEDRIKSGYYAGRGPMSIKEDISRMCRDVVKTINRGDTGDMNRIIAQFINLATRVRASKLLTGGEDFLKTLRDESSSSAKYKKHNKTRAERKYMSRSNGASFSNGSSDYSEYSSFREIKKNLSKLKKKSWNSASESSDDSESFSCSGSGSGSTFSDSESDSGIRSDSAARDLVDNSSKADEGFDLAADEREWGARMTKASLVPPVTRKYEIITEYLIVADEEEVQRKMRVSLPDDYEEKVKAQKSGAEETDMEIPEVKEYKPRKRPGDEVIEQEVYGIDPYTHNLLLDSMPDLEEWPLSEKRQFVEDEILRTLNKQVRDFTGSGNTPMTYPLRHVVHEILETAREQEDMRTQKLCGPLLEAIDNRVEDKYVAYRKGLGVVCNKDGGVEKDDFVVEFLGEVYPAWKWFEKQDGIRSLQKNDKDPAPEFYNIYLERPKGDADGYDLVVVDAMHKANYASRICHSCQPNCEAKVTAVDGQYQIGIYSVRPILFGEEITFDYNSVTESKDEHEASVCLCGSQVCRGSYLNLIGEGAFQKVLKEWHGLLDRHRLLLEACELNWVSEEDYIELGRAGLGSCLLGGLPDWLVAYSARLVRFINFERTKLPQEILKHNLEEKSKYFAEICLDVEKSDAEVQAEGVYNQRLQNLALTLDKVRYVLRRVFGDPKIAPPPLQKLSSEEKISMLWNGDGSLVQELLQYVSSHLLESSDLETLKVEIHAHDPSGAEDPEKDLQKSLLWLRDKVRGIQCTLKARHDAAADLIHVYAHTKSFYKIREYKSVTSPPVMISPLDMGPKYADKISGMTEYRKTYGRNYCLGQLIFWHNQSLADPDRALGKASRGCLALPDIGSFYARVQKPPRQRVYGHETVRFMVHRMVKQPQKAWPKDRIWEFKEFPKLVGSPMLDAVLNNSPLDSDMVRWLKNRPAVFQAMTDR